MRRDRQDLWLAGLVIAATAIAKLWLATRWDLLADEAYYARWSRELALGYHDQPPAVAWAIALGRAALGDTDLAVRVHAALAGAFAAVALLPHARDRLFGAIWWTAAPPLLWLTAFATPDALLLAAWAGAVSAAIAGGPWWLVAGACAGLAVWSKYTAALLLPLLWVGTGDWRSRWMWGGSALAGALVAPHAAWLVANEGVSVGFQLREGLLHPAPPGLVGPLLAVGQQLGVLTPLIALSVLGAWAVRPSDRVERVGWWTSAPVAGFFVAAALGGPPEAHWMAPAWIGAGLLLARADGRAARRVWAAAGTGLAASAVLVLHAEVGVFRLRDDPADRVREGRPLAAQVAQWALPEGVGPREPGVERSVPVRTERYQEAALIWWYSGIDARKQPGCGRVDQYDRWVTPPADRALFVRPRRSGDALCTDARYPERSSPHRFEAYGPTGRVVGRWDLFELSTGP